MTRWTALALLSLLAACAVAEEEVIVEEAIVLEEPVEAAPEARGTLCDSTETDGGIGGTGCPAE